VHVIRHGSPIPIDYLMYFSAGHMSNMVDLGIERARGYLQEAGYELKGVQPAEEVARKPVGLEFTEEMLGYWSPGEQNPVAGEERGQQQNRHLAFRLTIVADDLDRFLREADHAAHATGYVECAELGGRLAVEAGEFNLFVKDAATGTREMRYHLPFTGTDGAQYLLVGFKEVHDDPKLDMWSDTTTLFTRIHADESADGPVAGAGVLHLPLQNLAKQLTTFRIHHAENRLEEAKALSRFGTFFFGQLWDTYVRQVTRAFPGA
jgi:cholesterol oxidase